MKIYTKTGDDGTTGLIGGGRTHKASPRIAAIGDVDELNAALGFVRSAGVGELDALMETVQCWLFDLGAELASPTQHARQHRAIGANQIAELERSIDSQTDALEPLQHFILPGGAEASARIHLARAVCRRAERSILELNAQEPVSDEALAFINRLSDWLFVASRTVNAAAGVKDVRWRSTGD